MAIPWRTDYERLMEGVGWLPAGDRTQVEIRGRDRAAFFHNYCTADIRRLEVEGGCEAFITSPQGKTIGHTSVFCCPHSLVLDGDPQQAERLMAHLDRYVIREDVEMIDRSDQWTQLWVAGPRIAEALTLDEGTWPEKSWQHGPGKLAGQDVWLRRLAMIDAPLFAVVARTIDNREPLEDYLCQTLGAAVAGEAFQAARIECGFPRFGIDITENNLPQEVDRNPQAISFTKGCYLGQETVARIDALGHVNRKLVPLKIESSESPPAGTPLTRDGKSVGSITSVSFSPRLGSPLALAYLRKECNAPGSRLESTAGTAEVLSFPLAVIEGKDQ